MNSKVLAYLINTLFSKYFEQIGYLEDEDGISFRFIHKKNKFNIYLMYFSTENAFTCVYGEKNAELFEKGDMDVLKDYDNLEAIVIDICKFLNVPYEKAIVSAINKYNSDSINSLN